VLPGLVGMVQATEAIKLLTGVGEPLVGRLLLVNALAMTFRTVNMRKDPSCPACGTREIRSLVDYEQFCGIRAIEPAPADGVRDVTPRELAGRLSRGDDFDLVDVREPHEWDIARIPGARLIPLGDLAERLGELDARREVIVHCKSGGRSARAARLLAGHGFQQVANLAGGITRWSEEVDHDVPRY